MRNTPDVIVLCGGAGLRLRGVTGASPKSMASVAGRPFLEVLLRQLYRNGFRRVILAVGYQQQAIRSFFGEQFEGVNVVYSGESEPLGTGGAVRKAADLLESDAALIMNGDSYTDADLVAFVNDYQNRASDVSMLVVPAEGREDCGTVLADASGKVLQFQEKTLLEGSRYSNAGIYMLSHRMISQIPEGVQVSLENELFPRWLHQRASVRAFIHQGSCLDIGTPDRYSRAQDLLRDVEQAASSTAPGVRL